MTRYVGWLLAGLLAASAVALWLSPATPGAWGSKIPTLCKLGMLALGSMSAHAARASFDPGKARAGWTGIWAWFSLWTLGQATLAYPLVVANVVTPTPGPPDLFFLLGYGAAFFGLVSFIRAWSASGMLPPQPATLAIAGLLAGGVATLVFPAIIKTAADLSEMTVMLGYAGLDLAMIVPAAWLFRGSRHLGGRLRWVWLCLLGGITAFCAGDLLNAYLTSVNLLAGRAPVDLLYCCGYTSAATGAWLQRKV